jgi:hypothetical protein
MADAEAATRSASEIGANVDPQAQLHLKLANDQIQKAKALMADGDNRGADFVLVRAKSDAELALSLSRARNAKTEAQQAIDQANSMRGQTVQPTPAQPSTAPQTQTNQGAPQ